VDSESAQSGIVLFVMGRLENVKKILRNSITIVLEFSALGIATHLPGSEQRVLK